MPRRTKEQIENDKNKNIKYEKNVHEYYQSIINMPEVKERMNKQYLSINKLMDIICDHINFIKIDHQYEIYPNTPRLEIILKYSTGHYQCFDDTTSQRDFFVNKIVFDELSHAK